MVNFLDPSGNGKVKALNRNLLVLVVESTLCNLPKPRVLGRAESREVTSKSLIWRWG